MKYIEFRLGFDVFSEKSFKKFLNGLKTTVGNSCHCILEPVNKFLENYTVKMPKLALNFNDFHEKVRYRCQF